MGIAAKASGGLSLGMGAFDLAAWGAGILAPNNALTTFNQQLHENPAYNMFQFSISALAVFSGSAHHTMKPMPRICFVGGTMIATATGLVAIEKINTGDTVTSTNPETGERAEKPVLKTFTNTASELVRVNVGGEEILATPSHPFFVANKGWTPAADLASGSALLLQDGGTAQIEAAAVERLERPALVYNLEVADWHTYHVGAAGILVHNKCDVDAGKPGSPEWRAAVKALAEGKGKGINANVETLEQARALIREARPDLIEYTDRGSYFMRQNKVVSGYELHPVEGSLNKGLPHIKWRDWSAGKSDGAEGHIFIHGE
jgi:hypothetical protein